jgi:hypothetical protein
MEGATGATGATGVDQTNAGRDRSFEKQQLYRNNVNAFFRVPAHYARLEKLVARGDIGQILYFFVKHFETSRYVRTRHGLVRVADQYRSALTSHMKRYYDFESREGRGDLDWHGQCNPAVEACEALGTVALPLPRLVAYQWLIYMDFDLHLWERFEDVSDAFTRFTLAAKERYQLSSQSRRRYRSAQGPAQREDSAPQPPGPPLPPGDVPASASRERDKMRRTRARREVGAHAAVFTHKEAGLHDFVHEEEEQD